MGDSNRCDYMSPLYLQRVRFVDGDYGPDGTYWGRSASVGALWCAFNKEHHDAAAGHGTRIYVRAHSRTEARLKVLAEYPGLRFVRSSS